MEKSREQKGKEFMFPHFTVREKGLRALPFPSLPIRESPIEHQAVGTRRGLMPTPGERRARGESGVGVQGDRGAQPSGDSPLPPPGTPPRVLGATGTQSQGRRHPQRAQCAAQGLPCSAGTGSPQGGREESDPARAGAAPQRQGGSLGCPAWSRWPAAGARVPAGAYAPG